MPRESQMQAKRRELLPVIALAFADLGYRRTTTAELARRCGVQENILYRIWADKKAMFIAAIEHVYDQSVQSWRALLAVEDDEAATASTAERLLDHETRHHGQLGHYRIVFAGLSETDDPDVRRALAAMYRRYHRFVRDQISAHRGDDAARREPDAALVGWALVGLGTVASITRELGLLGTKQRQRLFGQIGHMLLQGQAR